MLFQKSGCKRLITTSICDSGLKSHFRNSKDEELPPKWIKYLKGDPLGDGMEILTTS